MLSGCGRNTVAVHMALCRVSVPARPFSGFAMDEMRRRGPRQEGRARTLVLRGDRNPPPKPGRIWLRVLSLSDENLWNILPVGSVLNRWFDDHVSSGAATPGPGRWVRSIVCHTSEIMDAWREHEITSGRRPRFDPAAVKQSQSAISRKAYRQAWLDEVRPRWGAISRNKANRRRMRRVKQSQSGAGRHGDCGLEDGRLFRQATQ